MSMCRMASVVCLATLALMMSGNCVAQNPATFDRTFSELTAHAHAAASVENTNTGEYTPDIADDENQYAIYADATAGAAAVQGDTTSEYHTMGSVAVSPDIQPAFNFEGVIQSGVAVEQTDPNESIDNNLQGNTQVDVELVPSKPGSATFLVEMSWQHVTTPVLDPNDEEALYAINYHQSRDIDVSVRPNSTQMIRVFRNAQGKVEITVNNQTVYTSAASLDSVNGSANWNDDFAIDGTVSDPVTIEGSLSRGFGGTVRLDNDLQSSGQYTAVIGFKSFKEE